MVILRLTEVMNLKPGVELVLLLPCNIRDSVEKSILWGEKHIIEDK